MDAELEYAERATLLRIIAEQRERIVTLEAQVAALSGQVQTLVARVAELAKTATVELMAHPEKADEQACLLSDRFGEMLRGLQIGTYSQLTAAAELAKRSAISDSHA